MLRLMQLLKNKREAFATAVSDEWWLMIHTNCISNPDWSKLSVYELEILSILSSAFAYVLTQH